MITHDPEIAVLPGVFSISGGRLRRVLTVDHDRRELLPPGLIDRLHGEEEGDTRKL